MSVHPMSRPTALVVAGALALCVAPVLSTPAAAQTVERDLLVILDGSGSMWGQIDGVAKITTTRTALSQLVGDLPAGTDLGLLAYGHRRRGDCGDTQMVLPVGPNDPARVAAVVQGIVPRGKTPIAGALDEARATLETSENRAEVLLISDGLETCGGDPCAAAAALAARGIGTRVHVVGFDLGPKERAALQCVAEEGGGLYLNADTASELTDALTEVVQEVAEAPIEPDESDFEAAEEAVEEPAPKTALFEETFDSPALDPTWRIENAAPDLAGFDGQGAFFTAVAGDTNVGVAGAANRLVLDRPVPGGDFDLVLEDRMAWQTGAERLWLSLHDMPDAQVAAGIAYDTAGCGTGMTLRLIRYAPVAEGGAGRS